MKKNAITYALSGKSKIFLLICLAAAFAADLAVFVTLLVLDAGAEYWAFPLVFLLADALFIAQAAFSNFRFAYTVWQIVIYCALTAAMLISTVVCNVCAGATAFTTTASALLIAVHAVALIAVISGYVYASRGISGGRTAQTVTAVIVSALCVAVTGLYGAFLGFGGYFGQGAGIRPVEYSLDENGDYIAVGTVGTKGDTVVIPEEFNGVKVSGINYSVFSATGISNVFLNCSADVNFYMDKLYGFGYNEDLTVYAEKQNVDKFKAGFYKTYAETENSRVLDLANKTVPYGLDNDEVYITFAYGTTEFEKAGRVPLPTWYGKKGDTLDMRYFDNIPYAKYSNKLSDRDLLWCWENVDDRVILSDFSINGGDSSVKINESSTEFVGFEKIYAVYPGKSNDLLHPIDREFVYTQADGQKTYKLTTAKNADGIIKPFKRDGFGVKWSYASSSSSTEYRTEFTSLSSALQYRTNRLVWIYPEWEMNAPNVNFGSDCAGDRAVYGDGVVLTADAVAPASGFKLEYSWAFKKTWSADYDSIDGLDGSVYAINMVRRSQAGTYGVNVKASSPESSLFSETFKELDLTVDRRPVTVEWDLPEESELVYDKKVKRATCRIKDGNVLTFDGVKDELGLIKTEFTYVNAGKNDLYTGLNGNDKDNYIISDGSNTRTMTIRKAPLKVTVSVEDKYFDFITNTCTYTIDGGIGDDDIYVYTNGLDSTAGRHRITCEMGDNLPSANYYIAECNNPEYVIHKQPLKLEWSIDGGDGFVYDGERHYITVTGTGTQGDLAGQPCDGYVVSDEHSLINAGVHNVGTYILNSNFEILTGAEHTFTVKKRVVNEVTLINADTVRIYSGYEHKPDCVIRGVGKDADKNIRVTGSGEINAGTHTFTPDGIEADYAGNYELGAVDNSGLKYTIKPAEVIADWEGLNVTYDGKAHLPAASASGCWKDGWLDVAVTREGDGVNAGTYSVKASLTDGLQAKNYVLLNATQILVIKKAELKVTPASKTVSAGRNFTLEYNVTGFKNGDTAESAGLNVTEIFVSGHKGETSLQAGRYNIVVFGTQVLKNYEVTYETGILTVVAEGL